ncbi:MAG TPA: inositol monophosphatase family protein [Gemmatimonadales bacterium]|nr:inositol monophosphatase family protein [Gemmatimonadales bacterium]
MAQNHDLLHVAERAARRAADHIRTVERPANPAEWDRKGAADFVTHVDREAERLITEIVLDAVPGSVVRGEELSPDATGADVVWVVDPLDGTTNYLHDYPAYAVSVAAVVGGEPVAGVVLDVTRDLVYTAAKDSGARCGERALHVSGVSNPTDALIGTGFPFKNPEDVARFMRQFPKILSATSGVRRAGSAALDLVDVAQGRLDGFWELTLAPWDIAAGLLLVREAGGAATDLRGARAPVAHGPIVAGNPTIHAWLLQALDAA